MSLTDETALERAIAHGQQRVQFADQVVWYRDIEQMEAVLGRMRARRIAKEKGRSPVIRFRTSKGTGEDRYRRP